MKEQTQSTGPSPCAKAPRRVNSPSVKGHGFLSRPGWCQTRHPTWPQLVAHVCKIGITHTHQLFVCLAIYILPDSKNDLRQLVIRCCENRHGKSKTTRKEEEEANIPTTWTNIVSVVNLTLFALDPRKLRAKFILLELHNLDNYLFKGNARLPVVQERQTFSQN